MLNLEKCYAVTVLTDELSKCNRYFSQCDNLELESRFLNKIVFVKGARLLLQKYSLGTSMGQLACS